MSGALAPGVKADVQPLIDAVVAVALRHAPRPLRVYLFGSWAEGRALTVSNLNIALDAQTPLGPAALLAIASDLDQLPTLRKIDVVDLHTVGQQFRKSVLERGELLYAG